jgi:hypothetical protein
MPFLPFEKLIYKTKIKEDEVIRRITDFMEPEKTFRFNLFQKTAKPYEGKINGRSFNLRRLIRYRNSFRPEIEGEISPDLNGTTINVKMRLHKAIIVFLCLWCGFVIYAFFGFLQESRTDPKFAAFLLIPVGMLLFVYILTIAAFSHESSRSKSDLQKLLEAEITEL